MRRRCDTPSQTSYKRYGALGVTVCDCWENSFETFLEDVGPKPSPKHSLDRINSTGNYEPGNVRWATSREQNLNRRNTIYVEYQSKRIPLSVACEKAGANYEAMRVRVRNKGMTFSEALADFKSSMA